VFVLLGATVPRRGLPRRYLPAAVIASGLAFVAVWGAADPAAIVARTDLHRGARGRSFDVSQAAGLGPDAVPALLAGLGDLRPAQGGRAASFRLRPVTGEGRRPGRQPVQIRRQRGPGSLVQLTVRGWCGWAGCAFPG
jgi:Domain of unknown function (DUF4173)